VQIAVDLLSHWDRMRSLLRYELCEDMANMLTERNAEQWFETGWE